MGALVVVALGMLGGAGLFVLALGLRGTTPLDASGTEGARRGLRVDARVPLAAMAGLVAFAATGWPVAAAFAAVGAYATPELRGARKRRTDTMARTEAVATWCEQLRDAIRAAAGLHEAIASTAAVAPAPIRVHVERLAVRLRREPLRVALTAFATDLDEPTADKIATALVLASERRSANLADLLSEVAASARQQATMQLRVEASRARLYTQTLVVCSITGAVVAALVLLNRTYLEPYDSATGQTMLVLIGGLFTASGLGLVRLGRPSRSPRVLQLTAERHT